MLYALVTQIELEAVSFSMANIFSQQMSHANLKKKSFGKLSEVLSILISTLHMIETLLQM